MIDIILEMGNFNLSSFLPGIVLLGASMAFSASLPASADEPQVVAAVFAPWQSSAAALTAAASAGNVTGTGSLPFIIVLNAEDKALRQRLYQAGALLVLDRSALGLCLSSQSGTAS